MFTDASGGLTWRYTYRPLRALAEIGREVSQDDALQSAGNRRVKSRQTRRQVNRSPWLLATIPMQSSSDPLVVLLLDSSLSGCIAVQFKKQSFLFANAVYVTFLCKEVSLYTRSNLSEAESADMRYYPRLDSCMLESRPSLARPLQSHPHLYVTLRFAPVGILRGNFHLRPTNPSDRDVQKSLESLLYLLCYLFSTLQVGRINAPLEIRHKSWMVTRCGWIFDERYKNEIGNVRMKATTSDKEFGRKVLSRFSSSFKDYIFMAIWLWKIAFENVRVPGYEKTAVRRERDIAPRRMRDGERALYNAFEFLDLETRRVARNNYYNELYRAQQKEKGGDQSPGQMECKVSQHEGGSEQTTKQTETSAEEARSLSGAEAGSGAGDIGNVVEDFPDDPEVEFLGSGCLKCNSWRCRMVFHAYHDKKVIVTAREVTQYRPPGEVCPS